jgi:hypothetical protein
MGPGAIFPPFPRKLSGGDELLILTKTEHEAELRRVFASNGASR